MQSCQNHYSHQINQEIAKYKKKKQFIYREYLWIFNSCLGILLDMFTLGNLKFGICWNCLKYPNITIVSLQRWWLDGNSSKFQDIFEYFSCLRYPISEVFHKIWPYWTNTLIISDRSSQEPHELNNLNSSSMQGKS